MANPFGSPATSRTIVDGARVRSTHNGSCRLTSFAEDGWTTAVGLPGRLPTSTARCFTLSGWRRASCSADVAPADTPMTSIRSMPSRSSSAVEPSARRFHVAPVPQVDTRCGDRHTADHSRQDRWCHEASPTASRRAFITPKQSICRTCTAGRKDVRTASFSPLSSAPSAEKPAVSGGCSPWITRFPANPGREVAGRLPKIPRSLRILSLPCHPIAFTVAESALPGAGI
jgi:hypothetical protein